MAEESNTTVVEDDPKTIPVKDPPVVDDTTEEDEESKEALELYHALKDPKKGRHVLEILAREAGILETKKDVKEAKNEIIEALEETLGAEYKWLAPKLGPALEKMLNKQTERMEQRFTEMSEKDIEVETDTAIDFLVKEYKDFGDFTKQITLLTKQFTPQKGMSQKEYLTKLYKLAKAEAGQTVQGARLKKAQTDVISRLAPVGGNDRTNTSKDNSRPTRRQAIEKAFNDLESESQT